MACDIDPDLPKAGIPRLNKAAYERNFGAAKFCIEDLQVRVEALETGGGGAGVVTFEGRTGVVVSQSGDYDAAEISSLGPLATPTLAASQTLLADNNGRDLFQQYRDAPSQFTTDFTFSEATSGRALIQINPSTVDVEMLLPDATGLTGKDGWLCDVRVASGANLASVRVAVPGQMAVQNGYSTFNATADEQFFGLSQATALNNVYSLFKRGGVYQWQAGFFRNASADDLTLDLAVQEEGSPVEAVTKALNFTGAGVTATGGPNGVATIAIPGGGGTPLSTEDAGIEVEADTQIINFTGAGVTASSAGGNQVNVNISGVAPGSGNGLYGSAIVPATADLAGLNAAIAATTAASNIIFCDSAQGTFNLAGANLNLMNKAFPIIIVGDGSTIFDGGVGAPARGSRKFDVRSSVSWRGINWQNFNEICTFGNMDSLIELTEVLDCTFDNTAAMLQYGSGQGFDPGAAFGTIRVNRNKVTNNPHDFVRLQLGTGGGGVHVGVELFEALGNELDGWQRAGICCFYDNVPTGAVYPVRGRAIVFGNTLRNQVADENDAFGVRVDACESDYIEGNYGFNCKRGLSTGGQEFIYSKAPYNVIKGNMIIDCGENQACIALKGQDAANPADLKQSIVANNTIEVTTNDFESAIWIQRSNVLIEGNMIRGPFANYALASQSADPYTNVNVRNNQIEMTGAATNPGWEFFGEHANWVSQNNTWISDQANAHTVIRVVSSLAGGNLIDNPLISGDTFINRGAGAVTAVVIENRFAGNIVDPNVNGCHFVDIATAVNIINTAPAGTVRVRNNTNAGAAPAITNGAGATLDATNNSF